MNSVAHPFLLSLIYEPSYIEPSEKGCGVAECTCAQWRINKIQFEIIISRIYFRAFHIFVLDLQVHHHTVLISLKEWQRRVNIGWSQLFEEQTADPEPVDDSTTDPKSVGNKKSTGKVSVSWDGRRLCFQGVQGTAKTNHESSPLKNGPLLRKQQILRPVAVISKLGPVSKSCHHDWKPQKVAGKVFF